MPCYKILILISSILIFILSCKNTPTEKPKDFTQLNWILGHWEVNKGSEYETWYQLNDTTFFGRNFRVYNGNDTLITETIQLVKRGNEIIYIPTVKTSKGDKQVQFKLTSDSDTQFVFENPQHDYPKKITYTYLDEKTAKAQIEGGNRKIEYQFVRLK